MTLWMRHDIGERNPMARRRATVASAAPAVNRGQTLSSGGAGGRPSRHELAVGDHRATLEHRLERAAAGGEDPWPLSVGRVEGDPHERPSLFEPQPRRRDRDGARAAPGAAGAPARRRGPNPCAPPPPAPPPPPSAEPP